MSEAPHANLLSIGLYDLDRNIRPVGEAYKQLIKDWREVLPTQSVCLNVPIIVPDEFNISRESNKEAEKVEKNETKTPELFNAAKNSK